MDVNQFIQNVISGNAVEAKESLNDILSSRAFSSLDEYKKEIAQKLYATEEDIEVQNTADTEIEEDDLLTQEEFDSLSEEEQQMYLEAIEQLDEKIKVGHKVTIDYPGTAAHGKKGVVGDIKDGQAKVHIGGALGVQKHMKFDSGAFAKPGTKVPVGKDGKGISVGGTTTHVPVSALKRVDEETEQLDELKKSTLGSYVKKASRNLANQSFDHGEDEHRQYGDPEDTEREADMKKRERDIENRQKGINRAASKLSKEEVEQIDEVGDTPAGKKMLGSYLKKRTKQIPGIERNYQMTPYEDGPMGAKTIKKFQKKVNKGMGRAIDRLTKEESEQIDEVSQKTAINAFVKRAGREEDDDSKSTKTMDRIFKKHGQKGVIKAANALDKEHRPFSSDYTKKDYISGVLAKHGAGQNYDDRNKPSPKPSKGPVKGRGYA